MAYSVEEQDEKTESFIGIVLATMLTFMAAAVCVACICGTVAIVKNTVDYIHTH